MMKYYVINLCVNTKNGDRYDKVAINKFPITVRCEGVDKLKDILRSEEMSDNIKNIIKQKYLYESALFYIREIDEDDVREYVWDVIGCVSVDY